mmetsp:Transcript_28425/g.62498  ORF Transcript_28425/g.62498 Transcript_28425/m.62498 type:complete len:607 (-) Transcript_28425:108-1928(-)
MPDDNGSATGGCSKHTYQTLRASGIRANRAVAYHHVPGQRGDTHHSGLGDSTQLPSCWPWRRVLQRLFANKSRSSSSHSKDVSKPAVMHYAARISSQTGSRASASSPQHDGTTAFKALPAEHDLLYPGLADTPKHGSLISAPSACSTVSEHCVRPCRMATGGSQSGIPGSPAPPPFVSISLDTNRAPSTGGMHAPNPHIWHASDEGEEELHVQDLVPPLTPKPYTTQRSRSVRFSDQSRAGSGRPMERDSTREELTALSSWISGEVRDSPPSRSTSSLNLQQMGDDLLNTLGSAASNVLHETGARLYPAPAAGSYSRGGDARPGPTDGSLQLRSHSSPAVQAVHGMGMCRRCKSHRQYGSRGSSQISAQTSGTLHRCSLENGKAEQPGRQHPKPEERHVHQDMAAVIEQEFTQGSTTSLSSPTLLRHDRAHTSAQLSMRQAHTQAGYVELEGHFAYPSARQRFGSTNVGVHPSSPQPLMRTQDSASSPLFAHSSLVAGPGSSCSLPTPPGHRQWGSQWGDAAQAASGLAPPAAAAAACRLCPQPAWRCRSGIQPASHGPLATHLGPKQTATRPAGGGGQGQPQGQARPETSACPPSCSTPRRAPSA